MMATHDMLSAAHLLRTVCSAVQLVASIIVAPAVVPFDFSPPFLTSLMDYNI